VFSKRKNVYQIEEGKELAPRFDADGLLPVVTTDSTTGEVLMLGYMNEEALKKTVETRLAHYFSRSRKLLWKKGDTSGLYQHVVEIRIDDDQDAVWLRVRVDGGASCHVGYRSCFYRAITDDGALEFKEKEKVFDPEEVYPNAENPTRI